MEKAYYTEEPSKILYMPLPNGVYADVWLRKNIAQETQETETSEDGATSTQTVWTADEVYIQTAMSEMEVESAFDTLFETGETVIEDVSESDRLDAIEAALMEMASMLITE